MTIALSSARVAIIVCLIQFGITSVGQVAERPNVIVVMTDDQGYGDVGFNGNRLIRTPHLDEFAKSGIRMNRFYCSPVCAPTRASLLTGRYYYRTGVIHTSRGGAKMHGDEVTLAERFAQSGYRTGIFGKWHLGDAFPMRPQDQGFHHALVHRSGGIGQTPDRPNPYQDPILWKDGHRWQSEGYCTNVFFDAAMDFIEQQQDEPFFVYLAPNVPHTPLEIDQDLVEPYLELGLDPTTAQVYAMVENFDQNFGRLLSRLDQRSLRNNTIIVFLTDNGPQQKRFNAGLRGRKSSPYEGGIRVPCVWQWTARWQSPATVDAVSAHIDIVPTLLALCGIESPTPTSQPLDGRSLVPLLDGNTDRWSDERSLIFQCHRGLQPMPFQNCAVVQQRYKFVANPGSFSRESPILPQDSHVELFDIEADAEEQNDLAEQMPDEVKRLQAIYQQWFQDVRSTRHFESGRIQVGHPAEPRVLLCRYQDARYEQGRPTGWPVHVVTAGWYRVLFPNDRFHAESAITIDWSDQRRVLSIDRNAVSARVYLAAGQGLLKIEHRSPSQPEVPSDNSTQGDVEIWLEAR